ncbi:MAG TPA: hypothetical protein VFZ65_14035 [Planctomycetota bacterium]|nr:hypothetical protein [Planctomycetota bacterium]
MRLAIASLVTAGFAAAAPPQEPTPPAATSPQPAPRFAQGGDLDKIEWIRPFARARELAREQHRVMLVKPILGGSNRPRPGGVPCGGTNDCEGSW